MPRPQAPELVRVNGRPECIQVGNDPEEAPGRKPNAFRARSPPLTSFHPMVLNHRLSTARFLVEQKVTLNLCLKKDLELQLLIFRRYCFLASAIGAIALINRLLQK